MNRIVRNYPVERLPEDLREGLHGRVTIQLDVEHGPARSKPLKAFIGALPNIYDPGQDVVDYLRNGRDDR